MLADPAIDLGVERGVVTIKAGRCTYEDDGEPVAAERAVGHVEDRTKDWGKVASQVAPSSRIESVSGPGFRRTT